MGGMKGGKGSVGLRGRRAFLLFIVAMCASIFFWASERTPRLTLSVAPKQRLDLRPRDVIIVENDDDGDDDDGGGGGGGSRELAKRLDELVAGGAGDSARPEGATVVSSASGHEELQSPPLPVSRRECNYAKGEWVADSRRPLYSGDGCKRWLSEMWACRLTRRTDFSFEAFRWQPENCPMPEFHGSSFLERMRGKTLAFIGDSLGRQQFQSLMCMITAGKEDMQVEDVGEEYGFVTAEGSLRPSGWAYRFSSTNATVLYHWSATLCELEPFNISDPTITVAMHLDRPASFLKQYLHKLDVLVLNTGHHWNRGKLNGNRWEMYVGGAPVRDRYLRMIGNAKNFTVHSVVKWLDQQLPSHPHLKAFFRSISPRHFFNGEWNTGGSCDNTSPLTHGNRILQEGSDDLMAASAVRGTNVKFLDITALSQLRDEGHISKYGMKSSSVVHDCLHWCLPGIPDTWNEILAAQL